MKNKRLIHGDMFPIIGIIALLILFSILTGFKSIAPSNLELILQQSYVLLICAVGVFFVMSMGGLDFSQGSIIGIASIVVILAGQKSLFLGLMSGVATGAAIGLLNGFIHVKYKIGSFIVTICSQLIFRGVCAYLTTSAPFSAPIYMYMLNIDAIAIPIVVATLVIGWIAASRMKPGKYVRMIGAGETATRYSGVNVGKTKILVFMTAGLLAGLAATINVLRVGSITASAGTLTETNVMIALVLGGLPVSGGSETKFSSVLLGVLMLSILNNGLVLLKVEPAMQQLIKGVIFLAIVAVTTDRKSLAVIK